MAKILMIDDDERFATLLKTVVEAAGFEMEHAVDGGRGLDKARAWKPDMILLDVMMPGLDGGDVKSLLEKDPALNKIPVLFLTSLVDAKETGQKGRLFGDGTVMSKFCPHGEILVKIQGMLQSATNRAV